MSLNALSDMTPSGSSSWPLPSASPQSPSGTSTDSFAGASGSSAPSRPWINNPVDLVMLPSDAQSLQCSRELMRKTAYFINLMLGTWPKMDNTAIQAYVNRASGTVDAALTFEFLGRAKRLNCVDHRAYGTWTTLLAEHYDVLTYASINPACRQWMWARHWNELLVALSLGLLLERLVVSSEPGMSPTVTPQADLSLSAEMLLFASDAQLYGVAHREALKAQMHGVWSVCLEQARPFLTKQFEFVVGK